MIRAPKIIYSKWETIAVDILIPSQIGSWFRNRGNNVMNVAPSMPPTIEPNPPMMTMNRMLNDKLISNARGSQEPK